MPKELYNEGRVVGFSAYETYVKQALATDGVTEVATEREWLASTIANGSSLLLKIPANTAAGVREFALPSGSRLVGANTIIASFAYGVDAEFSGNWATRIKSYGDIAQTPAAATASNTGMSNKDGSTPSKNRCTTEQMQYIKIIDGIVYQKGKWKASTFGDSDSGTQEPKTIPDKVSYGQSVVRLAIGSKITVDFYVLLTGFTDLAVVYGVTGLEGDSTNISNNDWKNGGFLGPSKFPWASKIWFATPGNLTYELKMGLSNGGKKNVVITSDPDSPITTIEVLNNIHTSKSSNFLKINQTLDGGDTDINIDGKALIDDILAPGIGTNIVDSTTDPKNSYGTARKVVKTNINAPNASGITIDPLSSSSNAQGTQVQNISTNLVSDNGSGIDYEDGSGTAKKIKTVLESGKGTGITISAGSGKAKKIVTNLSAGTGIQIGNKIEQGDTDTSKTIATNISVGNGLQINKLSSRDDTGAQTISHNLVNGTGVAIGTRAELGVSTTAITNNGTEAPTINDTVKPISELKLHDTVRYDNTRFRWDGSKWLAQGKASNATTGRPTIIYSNIKSDGSIAISPASASTANSAQIINTNLKQGTGIAVNNTNGNIQSRLTPGVGIDINPASGTTDSAQTIKSTLKDGKGTKVTNGAASGTSGGSQQVDINLISGTGITVNNSNGTISAKLEAGTGITIIPTSSGAYRIVNSLPNYGAADRFYQLDISNAYHYENGYYNGRHGFGSGGSRSEWRMSTFGLDNPESDGVDGPEIKDKNGSRVDGMRMYVYPIWNDDGKIYRIEFRIYSGQGGTYYDSQNRQIWVKPMNSTPYKCTWLSTWGGIAGDDSIDSTWTMYPTQFTNKSQYIDVICRSAIVGINFNSISTLDNIPKPYPDFEDFSPSLLSKFRSIDTTSDRGSYQYKAFGHNSFNGSIYPQFQCAGYIMGGRTQVRNRLKWNSQCSLLICGFSCGTTTDAHSYGFPGSYIFGWDKTKSSMTASDYTYYTNIIATDTSRYNFDKEGLIMQMDISFTGSFRDRDWSLG